MTQLALAAFVFVAMHIVPAMAVRETIIRKIGDPAYMGLFSLASFMGLAWMVHAYAEAPWTEPLWVTGPVVRILSAAAMLLAFVLLICGALSKNPTSMLGKDALKGRGTWNNIFAVTRHPVMWAAALWGIVHMVNRPNAASAIFFGSIAFLAVAGTWRQEQRKAREFGKAWDAFARQTSFFPFAGLVSGKSKLDIRQLGGWPMAIAVILWATILHFHGALFGVSPLHL